MDRIILEVDDQVEDFNQFIKELQDKAIKRRLTKDILNDILSEEISQ